MPRREGPKKLPAEGVACHPATQAWRAVQGTDGEVRGITMLTDKQKSSVYRLELSGWMRDSVIAKVCAKTYGTAPDVEQWVYRDVLPSAGLPTLEMYGQLEEPSGDAFWLF